MESATGYPGYDSLMPKSCGTVAEVLKQNGYNTSWFGKNHNVPDWQTSQAGPFDLWPTGLGFEYFYGFIGGDTDQWHSALFEGTKPIEAEEQSGGKPTPLRPDSWPTSAIELDPHAACHGAGQAVLRLLRARAPPTRRTMRPKSGSTKFKGQFDQGWDKVREETLARQKQARRRACRHQADARVRTRSRRGTR